MATLTINSAAVVAPLMSYDNYYANSNRFTCGSGSTGNGVSFNSSGGYRTGVNFTGGTAATLRIISYTDIMTEIEPGEPETLLTGYTPSILEDSLGNPLSYPHDVTLTSNSMRDVGINQSSASPELLCPSVQFYQVKRRRILTYQVIDSLGNVGPTRTAQLDFTYIPPA